MVCRPKFWLLSRYLSGLPILFVSLPRHPRGSSAIRLSRRTVVRAGIRTSNTCSSKSLPWTLDHLDALLYITRFCGCSTEDGLNAKAFVVVHRMVGAKISSKLSRLSQKSRITIVLKYALNAEVNGQTTTVPWNERQAGQSYFILSGLMQIRSLNVRKGTNREMWLHLTYVYQFLDGYTRINDTLEGIVPNLTTCQPWQTSLEPCQPWAFCSVFCWR